MINILEHFESHEIRRFAKGELLMAHGEQSNLIFVLITGAIEVVKGTVQVDYVTEPGAVFGEISALLDVGHSADVRAAEDSELYVIEEPRKYLVENPAVHLHVSELLARRVNDLVQYLSDVKVQFEGHDHIGMVDQVLDTLVFRQPRKRAINRLPDPE